MKYGERLKWAREYAKLSQAALAEKINGACSQANISKLELGNASGSEYTVQFAQACKVSALWLATGTGYPISDASNVSVVDTSKYKIPVINYIQAGAWHEACNPYEKGAALDFIYTSIPGSDCRFALVVKGDSMTPKFNEGDMIIVDPDIFPKPGEFVVAKNGEEEATLKKYRPKGINESGKEFFELVPLNEDYPSWRSDLIKIEIIGTVVELRIKLVR